MKLRIQNVACVFISSEIVTTRAQLLKRTNFTQLLDEILLRGEFLLDYFD